jgi:hypothetical protein
MPVVLLNQIFIPQNTFIHNTTVKLRQLHGAVVLCVTVFCETNTRVLFVILKYCA